MKVFNIIVILLCMFPRASYAEESVGTTCFNTGKDNILAFWHYIGYKNWELARKEIVMGKNIQGAIVFSLIENKKNNILSDMDYCFFLTGFNNEYSDCESANLDILSYSKQESVKGIFDIKLKDGRYFKEDFVADYCPSTNVK